MKTTRNQKVSNWIVRIALANGETHNLYYEGHTLQGIRTICKSLEKKGLVQVFRSID